MAGVRCHLSRPVAVAALLGVAGCGARSGLWEQQTDQPATLGPDDLRAEGGIIRSLQRHPDKRAIIAYYSWDDEPFSLHVQTYAPGQGWKRQRFTGALSSNHIASVAIGPSDMWALYSYPLEIGGEYGYEVALRRYRDRKWEDEIPLASVVTGTFVVPSGGLAIDELGNMMAVWTGQGFYMARIDAQGTITADHFGDTGFGLVAVESCVTGCEGFRWRLVVSSWPDDVIGTLRCGLVGPCESRFSQPLNTQFQVQPGGSLIFNTSYAWSDARLLGYFYIRGTSADRSFIAEFDQTLNVTRTFELPVYGSNIGVNLNSDDSGYTFFAAPSNSETCTTGAVLAQWANGDLPRLEVYSAADNVTGLAAAHYGLDKSVLAWTEGSKFEMYDCRPTRLRIARQVGQNWAPATTVSEVPPSDDNLLTLHSIHPGDDGLALIGYTEFDDKGGTIFARWMKEPE